MMLSPKGEAYDCLTKKNTYERLIKPTTPKLKLMRPLLLLKGRRICRTLLTAFIIFFSCYISNAQASGRGEESTVTFKGRDVPLSDLFKAIKKKTGYTVMYSLSVTQLDGKEKVTVDFNKAGIVEVMAYVLKGRNLVWTIVDESILIYKEDGVKKNKGPPVGVKEKSDTVINTVLPMVMGKVTDAEDKPIPGATVMIKGTRDGAVTDNEGVFSLANVSVNAQLIITSLGFKPRELVVKGKTMQIKMNVAVSDLDETLIIGYGTTTKRLATENIATVTAREIEKQPVTNPLQALQGRVAGMIVTQTSGYASAPFTVDIRGRNTIGNVPGDPLYIIDGVPLTILESEGGTSSYAGASTGFVQIPYMSGPAGGQSPFFSINPANIESINVLKDADASAIYGSRGANGVILITTKSGKSGKPIVDLKVYHGISAVTRHYNLLNTQQYLQMRKEAFANDGYSPGPGSGYDLITWDTTRYTDWQKYVWGSLGRTTDAELSLSGGNNQINFRIAAGYRHLTDITTVKGASERGTLQFKIAYKGFDQKLDFSFSNYYSVAKTNMVDISSMALVPPNAPPIFDSRGSLNFMGWRPAEGPVYIFGQLLQPYESTTYFLNSRIGVSYQMAKGLVVSASLGYSNAVANQKSVTPIISQNPARNPTGSSRIGYNSTVNWIVEPQITYDCYIGNGRLQALLGVSSQSPRYDGNYVNGINYTNDDLLGSISSAPFKDARDSYSRYKYAAIFGRVNYNWENKYILNASARRDGSSRFGSGRQYGNFGAIGVAWIFSEERLLKDNFPLLSLGKIRASYGTTGNDQIGDYGYLTRWMTTNVPYQGTLSYRPTQHANPDYQWQLNRKLELALDLNFFKDRINFEIAWYKNRCNNQLINYPLPIMTGFYSVIANSPADVQNTGTEVVMNTRIIDKEKLTWNISFNIGVNHNKLIAFPNIQQSPYAYHLLVGKSLSMRHLLHSTGVDPKTGEYTYEDKNKDGVVSRSLGPNSDLYAVDFTTKYSGGMGSDFKYKDWQLSLFFYFKNRLGANAYTAIQPPGGASNAPTEVLNRWKQPGDKASFARFTTNPVLSDFLLASSDAAFTDASFIRLSNLSLSYSLPEKWAKRARMNSCRVYFQGQNIFVITKYKGVDTETQNCGAMPPERIFTSGFEIVF